MSTTRIRRHIEAPPSRVYRALIDAEAVSRWMVPTGMSSEVHEFDSREGGRFRISLTYTEPTGTGKTTAHTDTFHGQFVELVPDERVAQVVEFESADPSMQGEMRITYRLAAVEGGTDVEGIHEGLPEGVEPELNEMGWADSMGKLAAMVEGG